MSEYLLIRRTRRWVPDWLWSLVGDVILWSGVLVPLFTEHDDDDCECHCHSEPGMRDCVFCGWKA